jgi:thiamine monophosphate kinase
VALGKLGDPTGYLLDRYRLPRPRLGLSIAGIAAAGMDVSDGLVQDLGHLCRGAALEAEIEARLVPLSDAARAAGPDWLASCLTGGDDYELLLAVPPEREVCTAIGGAGGRHACHADRELPSRSPRRHGPRPERARASSQPAGLESLLTTQRRDQR